MGLSAQDWCLVLPTAPWRFLLGKNHNEFPSCPGSRTCLTWGKMSPKVLNLVAVTVSVSCFTKFE